MMEQSRGRKREWLRPSPLQTADPGRDCPEGRAGALGSYALPSLVLGNEASGHSHKPVSPSTALLWSQQNAGLGPSQLLLLAQKSQEAAQPGGGGV